MPQSPLALLWLSPRPRGAVRVRVHAISAPLLVSSLLAAACLSIPLFPRGEPQIIATDESSRVSHLPAVSADAQDEPSATEILTPQSNMVESVPADQLDRSTLFPHLEAYEESLHLRPDLPSPLPPPPPPTSEIPTPAPPTPPSALPSEGDELGEVWFVGDSIAVGFSDYTSRRGDLLTGFIGAHSGEVLPGVSDELSGGGAVGYRNIIVSMGTNDSRDSTDQFRRNVADFAASSSDRCVVLLTIHRVTSAGSWEPLNNVIREVAAEWQHVRVVDWAAMASGNSSLLWDDDIHVRPEGYRSLWEAAKRELVACQNERTS